MDSLSNEFQQPAGTGSPGMTPVAVPERIITLDVIRGFALLGILLMNIPLFALPDAAYSNPNVWGGNDALNRWTLTLVYIFGEGKMRAIFSLIFGASALLFLDRSEQWSSGTRGADLYFRRTLWLMGFGIAHAYLIWWGDVLYPYALLGMILFAFRKLSSRTLLLAAAVQILILISGYIGEANQSQSTLDRYQVVLSLERDGTALDADQKKAKEDGEKLTERLHPPVETLEKEVTAYQGNYLQNIRFRARQAWESHQLPVYFPFMWDMLSLMFIGMALYRSGFLTGEQSTSLYVKTAAFTGVIGLAVNVFAMQFVWRHNFDPLAQYWMSPAIELGRILMMLCYVSILILLAKAAWATGLTKLLAAVGRMAFSNYISHSLICSVIFYGGYGFGLFGKLERWQLYPIVLGIWIFNLVWSSLWLRYFRFGPLEWCWRSLTYWKKQPMLIRSIPSEPTATATLQ